MEAGRDGKWANYLPTCATYFNLFFNEVYGFHVHMTANSQ